MTIHPALLLCSRLLLLAACAMAPAEDPVLSTEVIGTAFRVTFRSGRVVQGMELAGATLSLRLPGDATPRRVRLDGIVLDERDPRGEVLLYRARALDASDVASELCGEDPQGQRWMFPLRGQWDAEGQPISDAGFTLTCSAGAQGKCVRFGYQPWRVLPDGTDLADYHRACVHMIRANYCGDHATTRTGMLVDIYDRIGIQRPSADSDELSFEAAWGPAGAVCVAHTRVPANMTLDALGQSCPRLRARLGPSACGAAEAEAGRLGPALLFNRSH